MERKVYRGWERNSLPATLHSIVGQERVKQLVQAHPMMMKHLSSTFVINLLKKNHILTSADCTDAAAAASPGGKPRTEGGVGRRGAVWPTVGGWLATATDGAASDIAVSLSGMESAQKKVM